MKLVIVESPAKSHTIEKYLGSDYKVMASYGHIRDLSTTGQGGLGVDIEHDFKPTYIVSEDKKRVVASLKKEAKKADEIILATDPDREGEAISWHLAEVLNLDVKNTKRLEFHEITKPAIMKALDKPRTIDLNLVSSQETRRIIDRIMGFKLSTMLKRKIGSISAGRVQSVALKLITDREKEVQSFVPEEYWTIEASFNNKLFTAKLDKKADKDLKIKNEAEANEILTDLPRTFVCSQVKKTIKKIESKPPFTTSTLQQEAYNRYKFSTAKTSLLAQKLYEGIELGSETTGLITYMRTDSVRLSPEFINSANEFIENEYGKQYLGHAKIRKSQKGQVQDAHEAIRPTSLLNTPSKMKEYLSRDLYNLYTLIYNRALASLMAPRIDENTSVKLNNKDYEFKTDGSVLVFDGFTKIYNLEEDDTKSLPEFKEGLTYDVDEFVKEQHFTKAPSRFTEARLVKTMEEVGIGRPSTYASTISTLYKREYIKAENGALIPSKQGMLTTDRLEKYFPTFMDEKFTAKMETLLDNIVEGSSSRLTLLNQFYSSFQKLYENASETWIESYGKCPVCGKDLELKSSRFGVFIACSGYPECHYVKKEEKEQPQINEDKLCPKCGKPLVLRKSKRGEFYGCSGYPQCNYIEKDKPIEIENRVCPKCGGTLLIRKGVGKKSDFIACSNFPKCRYTESIKK